MFSCLLKLTPNITQHAQVALKWVTESSNIGLHVLSRRAQVNSKPPGLTQKYFSCRLTRRRRPGPVFLAQKLACWMNSFWCLLSFPSPSRLQTDILSSNSTAAWWGIEGAWVIVGSEEGLMEKERKKVCFSIKRLSVRLAGIHWLFHVFFDYTSLFYELNIKQLQQHKYILYHSF